MTRWTEKNKKALAGSRLMEPKTKVARLRALLIELEMSRSYGHTLTEIQAYLGEQELAFPSYKAFQKAYWRARKAGSLASGTAIVTSTVPVEGYEVGPSASRTPGPLPEKATGGAVIIHPTNKETQINKNPSLKDLI